MGRWPTARIGDVATVRSGFAFKSTDWLDSGIPVVKIANIKEGNLDMSGCSHVSPTTASQSRDCSLVAGDILVAMTGYIGDTAFVRQSYLPALVNQRVGKFAIVDESLLDRRFFFYALRSDSVRTAIRSLGYGSAQPNISPALIHQVTMPLPPLSEQRAIAEVLGALDDKIEANRRLADLCDSTWRAIAASELDGAQVPLSHLARFVNGGAYTNGASGTGRVVIRTPELTSGPSGSTIYSDRDVPADQLAQPGDLLFVWSGSLTAHRWFRAEAIINQHIFKVIPRAGVPLWLLHDRILGLLPEFISIAADKATTMGHIQRHHLDTPVLLPGPDKLAELDDACAPIWIRALAAERESLVLTQLRDFLLPKLVSGELRVGKGEALVEQAV